MTFFYNLNKTLDAIREKPETTHGQLNERDMSRAAKGYEKYGKQGMEALAKAGREGKALDPVRAKYDKYDNTEVDEGMGDMARKVGSMAKKVGGAALNKLGHGDDAEMMRDLQRKMGVPQTGKKPEQKTDEAAKYRDPKYKDKLYTQDPPSGDEDDSEDVYYNRVKPDNYQGAKRLKGGGEYDNNDPLVKGFGRSGTGSPVEKGPRKGLPLRSQVSSLKSSIKAAQGTHAEPNLPEAGASMTPKQKSFAKLAPPANKITFADKIAGAKKEVDEMLGDVAAEAMKSALSGGQKKLDKNDNGKLDANDFAMLRKGAKQKTTEEDDDNPFTNYKKPRAGGVDKPKVGSIERGHKHDIEHTATGRKVTRRVDPAGISVGADDDMPADGEKRGRGRPKKAGGPAQERVTANSRKVDRTRFQSKKTNEGDDEGDDIKQAMAMLKKAGYKVSKAADGAEQVDEKATSKKQQKFMGMVHATQKGEKAPSKEVAKVAKTMKKGDAEDFASTKHKGLPEKKKSEGKKKEKTEEAGGTGTPTASSGFGFGKGIYDSINRDLEAMIAESMSINMSDSTEGGKSLTITATDEDALKLGMLLKNAGLGGGGEEGSYMGGSGDSGCGDIEKAIDENAPDWPTDEEGTEDAMMYSGGLNGPKSTGQSTVPVLASQEERQHTYEADLQRMRDIAGIKEAKKPDFLDVDKDGDKKEPFKKAVDDKKEKKVEESIFALTNSWKAYKG